VVGNDKPALAMKFFLIPCIKPLWFDSLDSETDRTLCAAFDDRRARSNILEMLPKKTWTWNRMIHAALNRKLVEVNVLNSYGEMPGALL
jgi:hypothetical protein